MGRQVTFYMHPLDVAELQFEIERRGDAAIYASVSKTSVPMQLRNVLVSEYGSEPLTLLLARPRDAREIVTTRIDSEPAMHVIDDLRSPVVQFCRCYFGGDTIREGRLWFATGLFVGNTWAPKEPSFVKWADSWLRWVRRHYERREAKRYVGRHAADWLSVPGNALVC